MPVILSHKMEIAENRKLHLLKTILQYKQEELNWLNNASWNLKG
jgi:hypothetical protein